MKLSIDGITAEIKDPSQFLRTLRSVLSVSRKDMANDIGLSIVTLVKIEHGESKGSLETWAKILANVGQEAFEIASKVDGRASAGLESIGASTHENLKLYFLVAPNGELLFYDNEILGDEPTCSTEDNTEGRYISITGIEAKSILRRQREKLGS
jgi:DNA-binding XRE family transcriptional regulator